MTTDIAGIDHVALLVADVDASIPYYTGELGMTVVGDEVNEGANARLVYLDAGTMLLQLVSPTGPGAIADALANQGEGLHHICFQVPDIEKAAQDLAPGRDVKIGPGGRNRRTAFLPVRPNELVIELIEVDPWFDTTTES